MMSPAAKACCFAVLVILLAVTSLVYFVLYADVDFWRMRLRPFEDVRLAAFYGKQKTIGSRKILRNEIGAEVKKELKRRLEAAASDKKVNDNRTGAVLYLFDGVKPWDMPTNRNPNHLHIFWSMESSATLKVSKFTLQTEEKFGMNATMTYRRDSDFPTAYGGPQSLKYLVCRNDSIYQNIIAKKSKLAISIISDCSITKGAIVRLKLINQLKKAGLRIDTYGKCFSNWIDEDVLEDSIHQYKFYFAYENSYHCKDYITEKFFVYALTHNTVPVVWGATKRDYEGFVPPGSFIHAEDFDSPQHLIQYLEFLDQNDGEYLKYFRWRTMEAEQLPQYYRETGFCAMCRALHGINVDDRFNPRYIQSPIPPFTDGIAKRVIPSLRHYMYGDENPECLNPN